MTATDQARKLLEAAEHEPGGCPPRCEQCAAMLEACGTIDYNAKPTLAVAVTLAEAQEQSHCNGKGCLGCKALDGWEGLDLGKEEG